MSRSSARAAAAETREGIGSLEDAIAFLENASGMAGSQSWRRHHEMAETHLDMAVDLVKLAKQVAEKSLWHLDTATDEDS